MAFKSLLNPRFKYRNADSTDIGKTFKRIRREQRRQQRVAADEEPKAELPVARDDGKRTRAR